MLLRGIDHIKQHDGAAWKAAESLALPSKLQVRACANVFCFVISVSCSAALTRLSHTAAAAVATFHGRSEYIAMRTGVHEGSMRSFPSAVVGPVLSLLRVVDR